MKGRGVSAPLPPLQGKNWKCPPHRRTRRNPENRDLEASSWGPAHDEPFRATRQYSTTRGEAPFQSGGGQARIFRAGHMSRKAIYQAGLQQCRGGFYLRGSHSLKGAEEGKAGLLRAPGRERPSRALGKGQKVAVNPSEVPSVARVGGRGSLKGRGVSAPLPPLQGKSGSREAFLAPWKGAPFQSGGGQAQIFRASHMSRKAIYQAGLQQCSGGSTSGAPTP